MATNDDDDKDKKPEFTQEICDFVEKQIRLKSVFTKSLEEELGRCGYVSNPKRAEIFIKSYCEIFGERPL